MSPVHSIPSAGTRLRRRPVRQSAASLFPECPDDTSPNDHPSGLGNKRREAAVAPAENGQSGSSAGLPLADCPPPTPAVGGPQSQGHRWARNSAGPPVGIARLAARSPAAETHRRSGKRPQYFVLPVKSILNSCDSKRVPFEWTINPYRGCEFACKYCYARYTHEFMELRDGVDFERKIYVKQQAAWLLRQDLKKVKRGEEIAIGTATDPYQPAEKRFEITRGVLEELALHRGLQIGIVTKSDLVLRDTELLRRIAESNSLFVNLTVTTLDTGLARILEPRAPRP